MEIRLLTFNLHKGVGWQSRKSTFSQIHEQITELDSDIVMLQETLFTHFETLSLEKWHHCKFAKNSVYKNSYQGNAILSKFPLHYFKKIDLSMHKYEHRCLLHTIATISANKRLHLLCVHLGLFSKDRVKQINKIIDYLQKHIPLHEPIILGGDFNDWNSQATRLLHSQLELSEAFLIQHKHYARTYPAWSPFLRLDRVYFKNIDVVNAHRLVRKPWKNLSDHIAIEVTLRVEDDD